MHFATMASPIDSIDRKAENGTEKQLVVFNQSCKVLIMPLLYNGLFSNEFYFRIIRRGSLLRKFNSSNNKKPTINSNRIVRSRATTRECGCHGIASLP